MSEPDSAFKLSRAELIEVLSSAGISIPPHSKLPHEALEKRLKQCIGASQTLSTLIRLPRIDLSQYAKWPPKSSRKTFDAIRRGNFQERLMTAEARKMGMNGPVPLFTNAFMDIRQTLMTLAHDWDKAVKFVLMQDVKNDKYGILLHIIDVYALDDKTPLLVILYKTVSEDNPWPSFTFIPDVVAKEGPKGLRGISSTHLEQKLLLKILEINAKFLPSTFSPVRMDSEKDFEVSFLLPVGPLSFEDLGKLNLDPGCVVCGKKTVSRCSQCQSASYCGPECQKSDWPTHKTTCRSLKGGTWLTIPISVVLPGTEGIALTYVNRFNFSRGDDDSDEPVDPNQPPVNAYGQKLFLIKLQIGEENFLIYDRQRTMQVFLLEGKDATAFRKVKEEMEGPRGKYAGLKMYRWAKRVGDWELSVCLDKEPREEIKW